MRINPFIKKLVLLLLFASSMYGLSILYYAVTAGFTIGNITSTLAYDSRWDFPLPDNEEKEELVEALGQEFSYLGKGCQSYVFESHDGKYVIKFVKYQRFRPQAWINLFTFIPYVEKYQEGKRIEKSEKLSKLFTGWKIAYDSLKDQTGVLYVHLNKGMGLKMPQLNIRDKMGLKHRIDLNDMEFLLQRKATMLQSSIEELMGSGQENEATLLLDRLIAMLLWEYENGIADNDHALMQNTGVLDGFPIHIDVGQFIRNDSVKDPRVYYGEIYNKTFKLGEWLGKKYPDLAYHLRARLINILGIDFYYMAPYVYKGDVGKIPHIP